MVLDKLVPDRLGELFKVKKLINPSGKRIPKHVAINIAGNLRWAKNNKKLPEEGHRRGFDILRDAIGWQIKSDIPIVTFYLMPEALKDSEQLTPLLDAMVEFFNTLHSDEVLHQNQIKVSVIGKWYDLPGRIVDPIKKTLDATRDYDRHFLNFCINYDGQAEIVDACKLIVRKVQAGKIDVSEIDKALVKENIYASYFLPVDLFIVFLRKSLQGNLLWDSGNAVIHLSDKLWPEIGKGDLDKAIEFYERVSP